MSVQVIVKKCDKWLASWKVLSLYHTITVYYLELKILED